MSTDNIEDIRNVIIMLVSINNTISCGCYSRTVAIKGIAFNTVLVFRVDSNFWLHVYASLLFRYCSVLPVNNVTIKVSRASLAKILFMQEKTSIFQRKTF